MPFVGFSFVRPRGQWANIFSIRNAESAIVQRGQVNVRPEQQLSSCDSKASRPDPSSQWKTYYARVSICENELKFHNPSVERKKKQ